VVAGQFGAWMPTGAAAITGGGYEVAWKNGSADQYTVWNTDSSGNYSSNAIGVVSGSDYALRSLESSFHQDLNGDGVIGAAQLVQGKWVSSIDAGATLEILSSYSGSVVFAGTSGTLKLHFATVQNPTYAGDNSHAR
jgi:serralysin